MPAKYAGTCGTCRQRFAIGDPIASVLVDKRMTYHHGACRYPATALSRRTPRRAKSTAAPLRARHRIRESAGRRPTRASRARHRAEGRAVLRSSSHPARRPTRTRPATNHPPGLLRRTVLTAGPTCGELRSPQWRGVMPTGVRWMDIGSPFTAEGFSSVTPGVCTTQRRLHTSPSSLSDLPLQHQGAVVAVGVVCWALSWLSMLVGITNGVAPARSWRGSWMVPASAP